MKIFGAAIVALLSTTQAVYLESVLATENQGAPSQLDADLDDLDFVRVDNGVTGTIATVLSKVSDENNGKISEILDELKAEAAADLQKTEEVAEDDEEADVEEADVEEADVEEADDEEEDAVEVDDTPDKICVPIPDEKDGCTLTFNIDIEEGKINFVNVPNQIIDFITDKSDEE